MLAQAAADYAKLYQENWQLYRQAEQAKAREREQLVERAQAELELGHRVARGERALEALRAVLRAFPSPASDDGWARSVSVPVEDLSGWHRAAARDSWGSQ